jgi:hypothetical protein
MNPDGLFRKVAMVQFLDMLGTSMRGEPTEPRQVYMQRNAARYGVDLANLAR